MGFCVRTWPCVWSLSYREDALFVLNTASLPIRIQVELYNSTDEYGSIYKNCNCHDPLKRDFCARVWSYIVSIINLSWE